MGTSSRSVAFLTRLHAGVVVALAAMITCLLPKACDGAYTTQAAGAATIISRIDISQNLLPNDTDIKAAYPHGEGVDGAFAYMTNLTKSYSYLFYDGTEDEGYVHITAHTVGGTLNTWSPTAGQIDAVALPSHVNASSDVIGNARYDAVASSGVTTGINLLFDEQVRLTVWYMADSGGVVRINAGGVAQMFASDETGGISGSVEYVTTFANLRADAGADAQVSIDINPDSEIPSSADRKHPGAGASVAWVITSLDEPPPPPPPGPGTTGRLPVGLPIDPNGGFDPVPIGSRNLTVSPSSLTSVGVPTQVPFGEFQGALVESYAFSTGDIPITSLAIPTLPEGADLSLAFGQETRSVAAGEVVDFGPVGIEEFTLSGFDPASASQSPEALLLSLQFAGPGVTNVEARAVEFIAAADFNLDGAVDQGDLASWTSHFGEAAATHSQGDANGDGIVDGDDFLYWQRQVTPAAVTETVPEPSAVAMLGVLVCGLIYCRQGGPDE